jgi:hypothetical protein
VDTEYFFSYPKISLSLSLKKKRQPGWVDTEVELSIIAAVCGERSLTIINACQVFVFVFVVRFWE